MLESEKSIALLRLSAGISHDLNNIFMVIGGNLSMMKELWPMPNETNEAVGDMLLSVKRGIELSKKLQTYAGRQVLHPENIDLGQMINDTIDTLRSTVLENIKIEVTLSRSACMARIDPEYMRYALIELLTNARQAIVTPGVIKIMLKQCRNPGDILTNFAELKRNFLCISINDNGTGMSPEVLACAQDPLFTTKSNRTTRTGWGLSIVTGFLRQSGGDLVLGNSKLGGVCADVYLPIAE